MRRDSHGRNDVQDWSYDCDTALAEFGVHNGVGLRPKDISYGGCEKDKGHMDIFERIIVCKR